MSQHKQTPEEAMFKKVGEVSSQFDRVEKGLLGKLFSKGAPPAAQKDWVVDAEWARIQQHPVRAKRLLYVVVLTIITLIIWAAYAPLDEITRGSGKVIPSQKLQTVQSLDGGIVQEILVEEGQEVNRGDLLLRIDATRSQSSFQENITQALSLQAEIIRLKSLINEQPLNFPTHLIEEAPEVVERQRQLYYSNLRQRDEEINILDSQLFQREQALLEGIAARNQHRKNISLLKQELDAVKPLLNSGAVSKVEIFRLERELNALRGDLAQTNALIERSRGAINEAQNKIDELKASTMTKWQEQLSESSTKLSALQQAAKGLKDRVKQTDIRSPTKGTVQRLLANTEGGVLSPGQAILEIIPTDDVLIVEAKVAPKDIAFIRFGQPAMIKFSAYDFAIYGGAEAMVINISPDSITDENNETYYLVKLKTDANKLNPQIQVIPGMTAQADIITGKKTVLEYLLKPLLRASSQAMTER